MSFCYDGNHHSSHCHSTIQISSYYPLRCLDVVADVTVDNEDQKKGVEIMKYALTKPLSQIDDNAGLDASVIENQVTNARSSKGFDAPNEKMTDMIASGITDPAKTSSNLTSEEAHTPLSVDMEDSVEDQAPQGFVKLKLGKKFEEIQVDVLTKIREDWACSQQNTRTVMKPKRMNLNKRIVKDKRRKGRYSDEDICVATTILYGSKRTYNFLRNKKLLDLPSIRTVYRRLEKFTCPPGKSPQVMRLLEMKIKTLDEAERNVTLSCDEIYLEQKYSYCPRLRRGFGAVKVKIRLNHFLNLISNRYYYLEGASFHGTRHDDTFQDANILRL